MSKPKRVEQLRVKDIAGPTDIKYMRQLGRLKQRENAAIGRHIAEIVREVGAEILLKTGRTRIESMMRMLYRKAEAGNIRAAELLIERGWGKAVQPIAVNWREEVSGRGIDPDRVAAAIDQALESVATGTGGGDHRATAGEGDKGRGLPQLEAKPGTTDRGVQQ